MAIRVRYTHGYYRALHVFSAITGFMWLAIVWSASYAFWGFLASVGLDLGSLVSSLRDDRWWRLVDLIVVVVMLLYFICVCSLAAYLNSMTTGRWIHTVSTWLYIQLTLKTPVSLKDAASVMWLFVPNETGVWHPMTELLGVPKEQRRGHLLASADEIGRTLWAEQQSSGG